MSLFTSDRERNIWIRLAIIMVAIYSTLGPAQALAETLRAHNLLRLSFTALLVAIGVALLWVWAKRRPGWREIAAGLAIAAVYLWALARVNSVEERTHLIEYSFVAVLIYQAIAERKRNDSSVPSPIAVALVATLILGLMDEGIQALLPNRVFDIRDVGFNALAALMPMVVIMVLGYVRRWDRRRRGDREG